MTVTFPDHKRPLRRDLEDSRWQPIPLKLVTANLGMDKLFNISLFMVEIGIRADRFGCEAAEAYPELEEAYKEICRILMERRRQLVSYGCGEEVTICVSGIPY